MHMQELHITLVKQEFITGYHICFMKVEDVNNYSKSGNWSLLESIFKMRKIIISNFYMIFFW